MVKERLIIQSGVFNYESYCQTQTIVYGWLEMSIVKRHIEERPAVNQQAKVIVNRK
jgi:hypothetical protein